MDNLQLYIESLIFVTEKAIKLDDIKNTLTAHFGTPFKEKDIRAALDALIVKYDDEKYPFQVNEIADGFQFLTKGVYYPLVSQYLRLESKSKMSKSALETLAIISYKQPITKSGMEIIRGVNCDYAVTKLLEKGLVEMVGRAEGPGRPLLYGTTEKFLNHFGLKNLKELPTIKEFDKSQEIGVATDSLPESGDPAVIKDKMEAEANEDASIEEADNTSTETAIANETTTPQSPEEVEAEREPEKEVTIEAEEPSDNAEITTESTSDLETSEPIEPEKEVTIEAEEPSDNVEIETESTADPETSELIAPEKVSDTDSNSEDSKQISEEEQ